MGNLKPKPIFYILLTGALFWISVWYIGIFQAIMGLIVVSALAMLYLRLTDQI